MMFLFSHPDNFEAFIEVEGVRRTVAYVLRQRFLSDMQMIHKSDMGRETPLQLHHDIAGQIMTIRERADRLYEEKRLCVDIVGMGAALSSSTGRFVSSSA